MRGAWSQAGRGSGYVAERTRELCERHGVLMLYSPPYNGSCEAGGSSVKNRAARIASARET